MDQQLNRAKNFTLRFLSYRPRSAQEVADYLNKKSFSLSSIKQTITSLTELKFLDDAEFARWWVESRSRHRPSGPVKLKYELRQKGISRGLIATAIKLDYSLLAEKAFKSQAAKLTEKNPFKKKQKLIAFLRRRGFTWNQIQTATATNFSS